MDTSAAATWSFLRAASGSGIVAKGCPHAMERNVGSKSGPPPMRYQCRVCAWRGVAPADSLFGASHEAPNSHQPARRVWGHLAANTGTVRCPMHKGRTHGAGMCRGSVIVAHASPRAWGVWQGGAQSRTVRPGCHYLSSNPNYPSQVTTWLPGSQEKAELLTLGRWQLSANNRLGLDRTHSRRTRVWPRCVRAQEPAGALHLAG